MLCDLRDRLRLRRLRRAERRLNARYHKTISAASSAQEKADLEQQQAAEYWETIEPERDDILTRRTCRAADRAGVACPPYPTLLDDAGSKYWRRCNYTNRYLLTQEGHWLTWQRIREVRNYQRARWHSLLTILIGFLGVLAALVSALVSLGILHHLFPPP